MEDLAAEIEFIKIKGISYTPRECTKCKHGIANKDNTLCNPCPVNTYFDASSEDCHDCPADHYSVSGSVGGDSCVRREPCTADDYHVMYGDCDVAS